MSTGYLDKTGLQYFWGKIKAALLKDYNKTVSRGQQLITNGSAMMGDNTNFSSWTFDGSEANSSAGSFTRTGGYTNRSSDDYFPVDASRKYAFELDMKSLNNVGTMYSMLVFYDVDKIAISASNHMYYAGTLTTLARELKTGDTTVYLTDASAYSSRGTAGHLRAFIFWDYKNSFGYQYPPETYSRYYLADAWVDDSAIDYTNNTITLRTPYSGVTHPAGTYVSQGTSGGTYKYGPLAGNKIPTVWTHYKGYFSGIDYSGRNLGGMFPPGAAYCKVGFLWNYNSANDRFWMTNVSVKEIMSETDIDVIEYGGSDTGLGNSTPATSAKTYYLDDSKVTSLRPKVYYNTSGSEYTTLFAKGGTNGNFGTILKWGYVDKYLRILRRNSGNWSSDDWEKIDAGYADSSGSAGFAEGLKTNTVDGNTAVDAFRGTQFKHALVKNYTGQGLASNDGCLIWIPYNNTYGRQLLLEDTGYTIKTRYYNNGTWSDWVDMTINTAANASVFLNLLSTGSSTPVDNDYYISQYVNGGTTTTTYHRRPVSALWEYIKGKISSVLGLTVSQYGGNAATATLATNAENAATANGHLVESDVPANAKFTDTVTTATTSGNGNAVTAISASNGALTVTKGTTFLTSHQDISGKADKTATVSTVAWDSTNKKLTKTINGTTTDVVTAATLRTGLNVANGAEVNQNAFSNVAVGGSTIQADSKTDTLTIAGENGISVYGATSTDTVTIGFIDQDFEEYVKSLDMWGSANGVATLGSDGKVPSSQLPSSSVPVTGVKGDAESSYRSGQVNLTPANIGALGLDGGTLTGSLTVSNHSSAIGYSNSGTGSKSISSGTTAVALSGDISITAGTWMLVGQVEFPANNTGVRHIEWRDGSTAIGASQLTQTATTGSIATRMQSTIIVNATASKNMHLYCYQNSGGAKTVTYNWQLVRIA